MKPSKFRVRREGKTLALFCFLALTIGCWEQASDKPKTSTLSDAEKSSLNRLFLVADSLTSQAENIPASDSLLQVIAPLVEKSGRSKSTYQAHRQQILNLYYSERKKEAQILADSVVHQFALAEDTISALYNGLEGWLCWQMGNYREGIAPLERAATLFEEYGLEQKLNVIYNTLGISYGQLGDHEKAIQHYEAALQINEKHADSIKLSRNHKNLSFAYLNLGDLKKAEKHNRLGKIYQLKNNGSFELQAAEIYLYQGKTSLALQIVRELKNARPELFDADKVDNATHNLLSLGEILLAAGQWDEAIPSLKASLALQPEDASLADWMRTKNCCLLGNAYLKKENPALALPYFQLALTSSIPSFRPASVLENPSTDSLPPEVWAMEALRGKTAALDLISSGEQQKTSKEEAILQLRSALESAECAIHLIQILKNNFVEDNSRLWLGEYAFQNFYEKPLSIALRLAELSKDRTVLEKAFLFASKSKAGVLRTALAEKKKLLDAGISTDSIRQLRDLRLKAAAFQNQLNTTPSDSIRAALFKAKRDLDRFLKSLQMTPANQPGMDDFSIAALQNWLPDSTLLVEYFLGDQNLYVFSVSKTTFEVEAKPLPADFNAVTDGFHRSVSDWGWVVDSAIIAEAVYLKSASRLYDFLLKNALAAHPKTTRLFVVPDKKLARLPFAALLTRPFSGGWKETGLPVLIKDMAVSYRFSSAIPQRQTSGNKPSPRYGFGGFGTDYRDGTALSALQKSDDPASKRLLLALRGGPDTLDFADDEVDSIARLTGGQKWLNGQATKSNFLQNVEDCRILHISLHTVETDPHDPTGLAILFSKMTETDANLLTSSELYSLDLNTDLAVVSSCQSGFGQFRQGEGTLSLGRAMALAGCRATVVNLWKADDLASRDLMISFYKNLKLGQPKDLALQNALLFYLNNTISERAGPQFWANFSAVGEMDMLAFEEKNSAAWHLWLGIGVVLCLLFSVFYFRRRDK